MLKDSSSVANIVCNGFIIIHHVSPRNLSEQQRQQKKEPDPSTKCRKYNSSRSTQVYPFDLDPGNFCHPKNQSTQTNQLRHRDLGVQTVPCCQSSSTSQTACFLDISSRLRPFSGDAPKTNNNSNFSISPTTNNPPSKLNLDGPRIHGPFFCDCPGGVCKHRSSAPTTNPPSKLKLDEPIIHGPFFSDCPCACSVCKCSVCKYRS